MPQEMSIQLQENRTNCPLIWLETRHLHRRHEEHLIHFSSRPCCGQGLHFTLYSNPLPSSAWRIQQPISVEGEHMNFSCLFSGPATDFYSLHSKLQHSCWGNSTGFGKKARERFECRDADLRNTDRPIKQHYDKVFILFFLNIKFFFTHQFCW